MNPEDRELLERTLKLSEENNHLLKKLRSAQKRAALYGFIRLAIILVPLILGYIYLHPYITETIIDLQKFGLLR